MIASPSPEPEVQNPPRRTSTRIAALEKTKTETRILSATKGTNKIVETQAMDVNAAKTSAEAQDYGNMFGGRDNSSEVSSIENMVRVPDCYTAISVYECGHSEKGYTQHNYRCKVLSDGSKTSSENENETELATLPGNVISGQQQSAIDGLQGGARPTKCDNPVVDRQLERGACTACTIGAVGKDAKIEQTSVWVHAIQNIYHEKQGRRGSKLNGGGGPSGAGAHK